MNGVADIDDRLAQTGDAELIERVLAGDREAYAGLVARHQNALIGFLCSRLRDREPVEDLAQDALVEAYTHLGSLQDRSGFRPWLLGIARNVAHRWLRRARAEVHRLEVMAREPGLHTDGPPLPDVELERQQVRDAVWAAVDDLPESTREAVLLHYVGGLNDREIGQATGISASAARSRLHYARKRLRATMLPVAEEVLAEQRRDVRLTRAVMAALPFALPRPSTAATIVGLTTKELLVSIAGIVVIVSLLGVIWARESSSTEPGPPPQARVVRLATPEQRATLQLAMADGQAATPQQGRRVLLDYQPASGGGDIAGCLVPALRSVGIDWSLARMRGFLGQAFDFSMVADGGPFQEGMWLQWSFWPMLDHLPVELISARVKEPNASPPGGHEAAKRQGWTAIRAALDAGHPAIVWGAMTAEQRWGEGQEPLAWLWSLAVGYDEDAGTITARNRIVGEVTIRWDELGHADPTEDYNVMTVRPQTEPVDWLAANRQVLTRAIEASQGKAPGAQADAHGLAAYELWLAAFKKGTVSATHVGHHADYLARARGDAAVYLWEIEAEFPEAARPHLRSAADHYDDQTDALRDLGELFDAGPSDAERGAALLSKALEHERAALAALQQALDAS